MPTIGIKKRLLDARLHKVYNETEFDELCFEYGLELDDVILEKVVGQDKEEEVYKIELPANRYDLLSVEGLCRALRIFKSIDRIPKYEIREPKQMLRLKITKEAEHVRQYCVAAVLRNVTIDEDAYNSFIDLQDKLHQNLCRKRQLVSIGTHDLDTIEGPFLYTAEEPMKLKFKALNEPKESTAAQLMEKYSRDSHLRYYLHIIKDAPRYPVIYDKNNVVLSMPPIINSEHSKIIPNKTKNIFIEITATDLTKAKITLDTLITIFSEYCTEKFTVEPVIVENADNTMCRYPTLETRTERVNVDNINRAIGINITGDEMAKLLTRMCLETTFDKSANEVKVVVPPTRHDVLHACDIIEDVAIAFGYNNIVKTLPQMVTTGAQQPYMKLTEQLRHELAAANYTEVLTFALCSEDDISTKLRRVDNQAVRISNPKTLEFQVARTCILPGLLKTLACNKDMPLPIKLFEIQDVIIKDANNDVGARNARQLCAVYCAKSSGFEVVHGTLDRIMQLLDCRFPSDYCIQKTDDPRYLPGRGAIIILKHDGKEEIVGSMGILHPLVIKAFDLAMPISALTIDIDGFI